MLSLDVVSSECCITTMNHDLPDCVVLCGNLEMIKMTAHWSSIIHVLKVE